MISQNIWQSTILVKNCSLKILSIFSNQNKTLKSRLFQAKKPQMEKLRRARINESLNELKSLVLDAMKKDVRLQVFPAFVHSNFSSFLTIS